MDQPGFCTSPGPGPLVDQPGRCTSLGPGLAQVLAHSWTSLGAGLFQILDQPGSCTSPAPGLLPSEICQNAAQLPSLSSRRRPSLRPVRMHSVPRPTPSTHSTLHSGGRPLKSRLFASPLLWLHSPTPRPHGGWFWEEKTSSLLTFRVLIRTVSFGRVIYTGDIVLFFSFYVS